MEAASERCPGRRTGRARSKQGSRPISTGRWRRLRARLSHVPRWPLRRGHAAPRDPRAETRATLGCLLGSGQAAYFFGPALEPVLPFIEGAAAMVFCFSFFGFLASRLPRCSPFRHDQLRVPRTVPPFDQSGAATPLHRYHRTAVGATVVVLRPRSIGINRVRSSLCRRNPSAPWQTIRRPIDCRVRW